MLNISEKIGKEWERIDTYRYLSYVCIISTEKNRENTNFGDKFLPIFADFFAGFSRKKSGILLLNQQK